MTQHSSGTWIARGNTVFTEGDWACSVAVATNIGSLRKAEMNANARLIAAAPEMFEALRTIVEYGPQSGMKADAPMLIAARAAIAKATGQ